MNEYHKSSPTPGGVLVVPNSVSAADIQRLRREWEALHRGLPREEIGDPPPYRQFTRAITRPLLPSEGDE